jgi:hypothetical protein
MAEGVASIGVLHGEQEPLWLSHNCILAFWLCMHSDGKITSDQYIFWVYDDGEGGTAVVRRIEHLEVHLHSILLIARPELSRSCTS